MIRDVGLQLIIDVLGQPIDSIFKSLPRITLPLKTSATICPKTSGTS